MLDPVRHELHALVGVLDLGVIGAELFPDTAIARLPRIDGHDTEEMSVRATQHLHANLH